MHSRVRYFGTKWYHLRGFICVEKLVKNIANKQHVSIFKINALNISIMFQIFDPWT